VDFLIQWLFYLLAFVAGSGVALGLAALWVKRQNHEEVPVVSVYEVYPER
jgi:hypothetical protein